MRLNVPLAHGLAALALYAAPLLAQANCTSPNTDADYILGDAGGTASAMHWATGLVWKRCLEGQTFSGGQCTGTVTGKPWNDWMVDFMPQPFANLSNWWTNVFTYTPPAIPSNPPNRLLTGDWRMAYQKELASISDNCSDNPKLNHVVFPKAPSSYVWSGSPYAYGTSSAWYVHFSDGNSSNYGGRGNDDHVRLVRAGQPFTALASPAARTVAPNTQTSFAPITLSTDSGQAWGGVRISGDGSPEFQINGAGAWLQEAIVKSGDSLTVRLTAPTAGSHTATLTLRSGQTTGSADVATLGDEATTMQETSASFTVTASTAPVNGACGSASGDATASSPTANLCSAGEATTITGSGGQWQWGCNGQYGGTRTANNACTVPYASQTLTISAPATLLAGSTGSVNASSTSGLPVALGVSGPCTLNGSTVTGTAVGTCTITANQAGTGDADQGPGLPNRYLPAATTTQSITVLASHRVNASASPIAGGSVTCTPNPVAVGGSTTCTVTPNAGWQFSAWTGVCIDQSASCTLRNVQTDHTFMAEFVTTQDNCPTGPNTDDNYILGEAGGTASAMHWETGLVWKRCVEGQTFSGGQCTGMFWTGTWVGWVEAMKLLPQSFSNQGWWWIDSYLTQNLLFSGAWRMPYKNELLKIADSCGDNPKLNRVVFPNHPVAWAIRSGSPDANDRSSAWWVSFKNGDSGSIVHGFDFPALLVRGGQNFANLTSPAAKTAAPNTQTSFDSITLASTLTIGQAWGGVRISGAGNPEFQINNTGVWLQEAIVKSGDQITVRLTAPAAGSHTATLTLRSGWTAGTFPNGINGGSEDTAMRQTTANFTLNALAAPTTAQPIPTLGEWAMLLMAGLLGVLGAGVLRRRTAA